MTETLIQAVVSASIAADAAPAASQAPGPPTIFFELLSAAFAIVGTLFCLLAGLGVTRFPDVYTRMQAATKAGTLGVGCLVLAVPAHFASVAVFAEASLVIVFFFLTAPVASHLIGRAAYIGGNPVWARTRIDELRGCYDHDTHVLHPTPADHKNHPSHANAAGRIDTAPSDDGASTPRTSAAG